VAQTLGIRLRRWQTALGCGLLGTALAGYAVLVTDFHLAYEDFLILTYLWAPAWAAVVLLSFFGWGRGGARVALLAWIVGTVASLAFVNYANLFSNVGSTTRFFNQPMIDTLHGADLSGAVSVAVAASIFLLLGRLRRSP
jgi:NCS1 family nucleobase:cation symporter-1